MRSINTTKQSSTKEKDKGIWETNPNLTETKAGGFGEKDK